MHDFLQSLLLIPDYYYLIFDIDFVIKLITTYAFWAVVLRPKCESREMERST